MKKLSMLLCCAMLLPAVSAGAQPVVNPDGATLFLEPVVQKGLGGTSYDLAFSQGPGIVGMSRLEFPMWSLEAGISLGATIAVQGRRRWLFEAAFTHSTVPMPGTMLDWDWTEYPGYPRIPWSYTESADTTVSWVASAEIAWAFVASDIASLALYASYRYQTASHVENNISGWQYVWNPNRGTGGFDLYGIDDPTNDILEYSLSAHIPGIGLLAEVKPFPAMSVDFRACYTPVYVSDVDDHVLRTKLSTASGWGHGAFAALGLSFSLTGVFSGLTPYLSINGSFGYFVVSALQTQYWYGDADSVPKGTTYTGIGHVITSLQYQVGASIGFSL